MKNKKKQQKLIPIPKYVLVGNENVPEPIKIIKDYFDECSNRQFALCLVGNKETLNKDLKKIQSNDLDFVSAGKITNDEVKQYFYWLPIKVLTAIRYINQLVSNPENDFNKTNLGVHTLGLVPIKDIDELNKLGYGLTSWNGLQVYWNGN